MSKSEKVEAGKSKPEEAVSLSKGRVLEIREAAEEFLMIKGPVSLVAPKSLKAKAAPAPEPEESEPEITDAEASEPEVADPEATPPADAVTPPEQPETAPAPVAAEAPAEATPAVSSLEAASAAVKAAVEDLPAAPAPAPHAATDADPDAPPSDVPTGLIREMVEHSDVEDEAPAGDPLAQISMDEIPDSKVVLAEHDRWSELRTPLVDEGGILTDKDPNIFTEDPDEDDFDYEEPFPDEPLTPIDRIRAREQGAAAGTASPALLPEFETPPEPTFYGPDSTLSKTTRKGAGPNPDPTPPPKAVLRADPKKAPTEGRKWDTPSDHVMSRKAKFLWHVAIYQAVLAVPIALIMTSAFPPKLAAMHYASAAGCIVADFFELSGAQPDQPGYFPHLDHNRNGVACEAMAKRREMRKVTFIKPGDY